MAKSHLSVFCKQVEESSSTRELVISLYQDGGWMRVISYFGIDWKSISRKPCPSDTGKSPKPSPTISKAIHRAFDLEGIPFHKSYCTSKRRDKRNQHVEHVPQPRKRRQRIDKVTPVASVPPTLTCNEEPPDLLAKLESPDLNLLREFFAAGLRLVYRVDNARHAIEKIDRHEATISELRIKVSELEATLERKEHQLGEILRIGNQGD